MAKFGSAFSRLTMRGVDLVGAILLLILLAPAMIVVAMMVRATVGRSVLVACPRFGREGRLIRGLNFRTRGDGSTATPFGGLLRQTALDKLPLLYNILIGEMSLTGLIVSRS